MQHLSSGLLAEKTGFHRRSSDVKPW